MILLIDNYDSFTFNLYQALSALGAKVRVVRNDAMSVDRIAALKPEKIVLSPGPGRPEDAGVCLEVLRTLAGKVPILGVCLGHQAMAQAFGGKVVRARKMMHGKMSAIRHDGTGVFKGVENPMEATRYHSLMVERKSLPDGFVVNATAEDGTVMGLRHKRWPLAGVQFHPESIMTAHGPELLANFLR